MRLMMIWQSKLILKSVGARQGELSMNTRWASAGCSSRRTSSEASLRTTMKLAANSLTQIRILSSLKRIYVDETRISSRVRRRRGRFPAGVQPHSPKKVKYPGHVVICAIKNYDWLHPGIIYNKGGLKTEEFEDYVENTL